MKKLNTKKVILWILAVILCVTTCMPAFASTGDRVVYRTKSNADGSFEMDIGLRGAWKTGDGFCVLLRGTETKILRYNDIQGEPETFVLEMPDYSAMYSDGNETAEGIEGVEGLTGTDGAETPEKAEPSVAPAEESTGTDDGDEEDEDDEEDGFLLRLVIL